MSRINYDPNYQNLRDEWRRQRKINSFILNPLAYRGQAANGPITITIAIIVQVVSFQQILWG